MVAQLPSKSLTSYSLGGEIFSAITHGVAALCGLAVLVVGICAACMQDLGWIAISAMTIYGATAFLGFTISTIYHSLAKNRGRRVMRVLDHCSIYFIIAGTYTPFALIAIGGWVGWAIFGTNWALCALGTTLTAIDRKKFKHFAFVCYLTMGWIAVFAIVPIVKALGLGWSFWFLLGGGVAYTVGAFVYKKKGKYIHGIWHLFTLAGLLLQFLSILFLMLD